MSVFGDAINRFNRKLYKEIEMTTPLKRSNGMPKCVNVSIHIIICRLRWVFSRGGISERANESLTWHSMTTDNGCHNKPIESCIDWIEQKAKRVCGEARFDGCVLERGRPADVGHQNASDLTNIGVQYRTHWLLMLSLFLLSLHNSFTLVCVIASSALSVWKTEKRA